MNCTVRLADKQNLENMLNYKRPVCLMMFNLFFQVTGALAIRVRVFTVVKHDVLFMNGIFHIRNQRRKYSYRIEQSEHYG